MEATIRYSGSTLPRIPQEKIDDAIDGKLKIFYYDHEIKLKLNKADRARYEEALKNHVVIIRGMRERDPAANAFFFSCDNHNEPYIKVVEKKKYATVDCDLITTVNREGSVCKLPEDLAQKAVDILTRDSVHGAWITGLGGVIISSNRIPKDLAPTVAKQLYGIWQEYVEASGLKESPAPCDDPAPAQGRG
jgi:hypothetical protein